MRPHWIVFMPLFVAGCATPPPVARIISPPTPPVAVPAQAPTKFVETRYEVRGYREAAAPDLRHEPHVVFRRTRVPATAPDEVETVPRVSAPGLTDAPLPASTELAAELATQKTVTSEIRALQASMAEAERRMQAQYAQLVRQSAEVMKVRDQLEAERQRTHSPAPGSASLTSTAVGADAPAEVKW